MSYQKGNVNRSRPQKYQNSHGFKNALHDTSSRTKKINTIQVVNVCERCKDIIEWKIKYKKYKPLKAPGTCTKCEEKCVKHAYHSMCGPCAVKHEVCPKCGENRQIMREVTQEDSIKFDRELRLLFKTLPERRRRTFMRYMNKRDEGKERIGNSNGWKGRTSSEDAIEGKTFERIEEVAHSRDDLLKKLKSLLLSSESDDGCADDSTEEDSGTNSRDNS